MILQKVFFPLIQVMLQISSAGENVVSLVSIKIYGYFYFTRTSPNTIAFWSLTNMLFKEYVILNVTLWK